MRMIPGFERIDDAAPYMDAKVFGYIDSLERARALRNMIISIF